MSEMKPLKISEIYSDETFNCRGEITPISVTDLMQSIERDGLMQPIIVQPYHKIEGKIWRILAGHRRFLACQLLRWETINCIINSDISPTQAITLNLIENLQRKDLNMYQEAKAIEKYGHIPQDEIAKMLGRSRGWVQVRKHLLQLPEEAHILAAAGFLTAEHIMDLQHLTKEQALQALEVIKVTRLGGSSQRIKLREPKKRKSVRKVRETSDIFHMQEVMKNNFGNGMATRILAWCGGAITDNELFETCEAVAKEQGLHFVRPFYT